MLDQLIRYFKNPEYNVDDNPDIKYRFKVFFALLGLSLALSILLGIVISVLDNWVGLDFGAHALEGLTEQYSPEFVFLAAVFLAPVLEELLFRGPLIFFRHSPHFKYLFYAFTLVFAFYHLLNFQITMTVILFSPLLVAPQIGIGAILGFIRVRFGLLWAVLLHAFYNLILIGPILFFNPEQISPV